MKFCYKCNGQITQKEYENNKGLCNKGFCNNCDGLALKYNRRNGMSVNSD